MLVRDVQRWLEAWAPRHIAWEKDNVGLLVGSPLQTVRGILATLDVSPAVIEEARRKNANLIISHHPLLFRPVRRITPDDDAGRCLSLLLRHDISLYAAHTNLDFTRGGTSFALAEVLGLREVDFLKPLDETESKIVTFVPEDHADRVASAMGSAGAGMIGNYDQCSFRTEGTGTFRANRSARPAVGRRGTLERVREVRIEMIVDRWKIGQVVRAMKETHPYEEVAYDVYPLLNEAAGYGMGAIGLLPRAVRLDSFLRSVKTSLKIPHIRYTRGLQKPLRRVAVCGGSGSDLLEEAIRRDADVFITADIKYHTFHEAARRIVLIDSGHYETEYPVVRAMVKRLKHHVKQEGLHVPVHAPGTRTNPISYV